MVYQGKEGGPRTEPREGWWGEEKRMRAEQEQPGFPPGRSVWGPGQVGGSWPQGPAVPLCPAG